MYAYAGIRAKTVCNELVVMYIYINGGLLYGIIFNNDAALRLTIDGCQLQRTVWLHLFLLLLPWSASIQAHATMYDCGGQFLFMPFEMFIHHVIVCGCASVWTRSHKIMGEVSFRFSTSDKWNSQIHYRNAPQYSAFTLVCHSICLSCLHNCENTSSPNPICLQLSSTLS